MDKKSRSTSSTQQQPIPGADMTESTIFAREPGRLGIRIPRSAWKAAGHSASAAIWQKGILVSQGQVSEWIADDLRQVDDGIVCLGPGFDGLSLEELLHSGLDETTMIQRLASVVRAMNKLDQEGHLPSGIQGAGILVSADSEVLVLPPALVSRAATRGRSGKGYTPEADPAIAASAMLAGILRCIFLPRPAESIKHPSAAAMAGGHGDTIDTRAGEPFVPLGLIAPRLDPGLAALADRGMNQESATPTLADWVSAFEEAAGHGYFRELSAEQLARIELQRQSAETRANKKIARRRFVARRGSLLTALGITAVAIVALAVFDRPPPGPDLSALGPEAIVQTYYEAISSLDLALLEACLDGKTGRDDKSLLTNLTVVMKMRQAYSPDAPYLSAGDWLAAGSPALAEGIFMFGITGLEIRNLAEQAATQPSVGTSTAVQLGSAMESRFEARYTLWTTESNEELMRGVPAHRKDRLTLAEGRSGWKIIAIERENS
jgi:hypothetical protein